MGRRIKASAKPYLPGEEAGLREEFHRLSRALDFCRAYPEVHNRLEGILGSLKDPSDAISSLSSGETLSPAEMFVVAHLAFSVTRVQSTLRDLKDSSWAQSVIPPSLSDIEKRLMPGAAGQPVFYIGDSFSQELGKVRAAKKAKERALRLQMANEARAVEAILGRRAGIREEIALRKTNPESIEKARLMPELGETRETLTHVHFRLKATNQAVRLEREINRLRQRELSLVEEVLFSLSRELEPRVGDLEQAARALGELDYLLAKAKLSMMWNAAIPAVSDGPAPKIVIKGAFHPEVRRLTEARGNCFQPISIDVDSPVTVITGPNMGGKTVTLASIGLLVALAQWGLPVPCESLEFTLFDFIYMQPQAGGKPGLSSFAAEVISIKGVLARRGERGLILLDEIGRGTNPSQGLALYAAILKHYADPRENQSAVVATTHYHGLADLIQAPHWQVKGLSSDGDPGDNPESWPNGSNGLDWLYGHMDYRLQRVGQDTPTPQDALLVAKLLGLDESIIAEALVLFGLEKAPR